MAGIDKNLYNGLGLTKKPVANMNKYQDISEDLIEENLEIFFLYLLAISY